MNKILKSKMKVNNSGNNKRSIRKVTMLTNIMMRFWCPVNRVLLL
jgi:hypothetical protein